MNVTSIEVFPRRHRQTASASALVARYNADGTSDETAFDTSALTIAQAVAIQPVGSQSNIVVAGLATGSQFAMLRYLSNGSLDPSFVNTVSPFSGDSFTPERIAVQADGEIVVAGYVASADGTDLGIARYFANGSLDTGFGDGGGVTAGLTVAATDPCGLAIGSDGSIVAACTVQTGTSDYAFGVVRLASDGTLDTSFNQSGEVTDDWGDSCNHATSVAIESDGSILAGGYDASVSGDYVDLVRFLPDGSVDPNFLYGQLAYEPIAGGCLQRGDPAQQHDPCRRGIRGSGRRADGFWPRPTHGQRRGRSELWHERCFGAEFGQREPERGYGRGRPA